MMSHYGLTHSAACLAKAKQMERNKKQMILLIFILYSIKHTPSTCKNTEGDLIFMLSFHDLQFGLLQLKTYNLPAFSGVFLFFCQIPHVHFSKTTRHPMVQHKNHRKKTQRYNRYAWSFSF